jgi:hypothetical protein
MREPTPPRPAQISAAAVDRAAFTRERLGKGEQPLGCTCVEDEWRALLPCATRLGPQRCLGELPVIDEIRE